MLFRTATAGVVEVPGSAMALEKSLQTLFEANLEALLGVRLLASEFITNEGRMDTRRPTSDVAACAWSSVN